MKFDVVIGNPPYQQPAKGASTRQEPVYHLFYQLAFNLSDLVTLITPARFLFNVGQTPTSWNEKMLNDPHFKVIRYEKDGQRIFPHTDIKGGVAITLWDKNKDFGAIKVFTPDSTLNAIWQKVWEDSDGIGVKSFSDIVSSQGLFHFSEKATTENPKILRISGSGTGTKITSRVFAALSGIESAQGTKMRQTVTVVGLSKMKRVYKTFPRDYVIDNVFIDGWKVLVAKANGSGRFGEKLSTPFVGGPGFATTDTFMCIGPFSDKQTAEHVLSYVKTKFARAMLGILKSTQDNPRSTWKYVPMQDFSDNSDIDWSASISEIDNKLYQKYGLSQEEIDFIEQNVQVME